MNRKLLTGAAGALALSLAPLLLAQRRIAPLFAESATTVTGSVVQMQAMNPQSLLVLDVDNLDAEPARWQIILPGQQVLDCLGWNPNTLKPGNSVLVTGHAARSGAPMMMLVEGDSMLVDSTGKTLFAGSSSSRSRGGAACVAPRPAALAR